MGIRSFVPGDRARVLELWLQGNRAGHPFIAPDYWTEKLPDMAEIIPQAQVYVWEENGLIMGFVGLSGGEMAGLFVDRGHWGRGIGGELVAHCQSLRKPLTLWVYEKNHGATAFYEKLGFTVSGRGVDEETGEAELSMHWEK